MTTATMPAADVVFDTLFAYQRSGALKTAIELEIFTIIDSGANTAALIATKSGASERGIRILCDFLTTIGLLTKSDGNYGLSPESAAFLSKNSRAYLGTTMRFLLLPELKLNMDSLTEAVRSGGLPPTATNTVADENPIWIEFARSMWSMIMPPAEVIAELVAGTGDLKVLDIAAGHGFFGITIAQRNPRAEVVGVDWAGGLAGGAGRAHGGSVTDRDAT